MARGKQTSYDKYASKGPKDTVQYRDVYDNQQVDRSQMEELESPTWRVIVAILGGVLIALGVYIALSLISGSVGMFNNMTAGNGTGGGSTGFGAIGNVQDEPFGALAVNSEAPEASVYQEGGMVIIPGNTPIISKVDWMLQNGYTESGGVYYDINVQPVSSEDVLNAYFEYVKSQGGTLQTIEEYKASEGSVTGPSGSEGNETTQGTNGASETSQGQTDGNVENVGGNPAMVQPGDIQWLAMMVPMMVPTWWKVVASLFAGLISFALFYQVLMRNLATQNQLKDSSDINQYANDQHIAFPEEIQRKFDWFPDLGAHSAVQVSSLISHMMLSNKGLAPVQVGVRAKEDILDEDGHVETIKGELLCDEDGNVITKPMPMIDSDLSKALFKSAGIPDDLQVFYDARKIPYNPGNKNRDKLRGYDTVADLINKEWELPVYEPQRPAGAYLVDTAAVNTMV